MNRKLRMGMVGGGKDAFIGAIHRHAANMDGLIELVCGALSINPEIAKDSGKSLFLPEDRTYLTFKANHFHSRRGQTTQEKTCRHRIVALSHAYLFGLSDG